MRVEVINTGDELLLGRCVNTHQAFFGRRVFEVGLRIDRQVAVLDGEPIRGAMAEAFGRCDVLIMTGGLGPTSDDLTRDVAADLLGLEMSEDAGVIEVIEARLGARGKTVTADSRRQALVPRGAEVLANPNGTAPGLYLAAGEGTPHLFLLPGPPRELLPMFDAEVMPRLRAITVGGEMPGIREFKFFGVGESEVAAAVEPGVKSIDGIVHGYQVEAAHVNFRCIGTDEGLDAASALVGDVLGGFLVSDDGRSLEKVVVDLLVERGETACTAESCTGGAIASSITDVAGASEVFRRGYVTYANEAKAELLGVDMGLIEREGAVSEEVAEAMVLGALERSGDDHAVAVTGVAGPGGGSEEKPVGTVFIGIVSKGDERAWVRRYHYPFGRENFKAMVAKTALDHLRRRLMAG